MKGWTTITSGDPAESCGTKVPLQGGGYIQCDKPGIVVEVTLQQDSHRRLMCADHIRKWQESGLVVRILEGDDSYIPRRPRQFREEMSKYPCKICNRLCGEHSLREFDDHWDQFVAPTHRLFPKGKRAKKERIAHLKCRICERRYGEHSHQEYDACINQDMKRNKPKQEHLRYVKCEICGYRFGDHTPEKFDACVDQIIENSV